jgi:glutamine amidotransferase
MSGETVIVDYGVGNLRSVVRAVAHCGSTPNLSSDVSAIESCERLILPGVGAFGNCVAALRAHGFVEPVLKVIDSGRPVLGICVGMQMLLDSSEEFGQHEGLGRIPGKVLAVPPAGADGKPHKIPHIGWAGLEFGPKESNGTILEGVASGDACYFVHSFVAVPERSEHTLATTDYDGHKLCAAVRHENLYGVQFHPEKSGRVGLRILQNFLNLPAQ